MAENNNASRLYVVEESTPGTLKVPSAGSEALALQPGFELSPNAEVITNEELRATIGPSKPILGLEKPTASFSHYYRHSAVEGTVPDWHLLAKSLFGSTSTNGTERLTTSSSTTILIKLASGGSDFAKGKAILIKDGTNGYSIRPVDSVATNDLSIGFSVTAPASGLGVGKCINYTPVSTGHPLLSLWLYRANGAATEAIAGALISQLDLQVEVGQLINMTFTANGKLYYFNPITITSSSKYIDFNETGPTLRAASVTEKTYRTPHELASALSAAMNAVASDAITVVFNSIGANAGKFTISSAGSVLELLWQSGTNTANSIGTKLGFSVAADDTGALTYTSDNVQSYADAQTPSLDSSDPLVAKYSEVLIGDQSSYVSMCVQSMQASIALDVQDVLCIKAESGVDSQVVRRRNTSIQVTAVLEKHDADKFDRFLNNTETKFLFNTGVKSGGNWVAGRCLSLYCPQSRVSGFRVGDNDGIVTMVFTIDPYVDSSSNPEIYLNLL